MQGAYRLNPETRLEQGESLYEYVIAGDEQRSVFTRQSARPSVTRPFVCLVVPIEDSIQRRGIDENHER